MSEETNHRWLLARRAVGLPDDSVWTYDEAPVGEPGEGELLVEVLYISLDPAMRGWMNEGRSYAPPVGINEVMRAYAGGRVIASKDPRYEVGDHVTGLLGVQEYLVVPGNAVAKVDLDVAPLPVQLGTLGMPGMTAYFGLLEAGKPVSGNTVVVSAAAGAVGSVVCQIAKLKGCRAVGIAGGPEKCAYLVDELGVDAAIDYKSEDVAAALRRECPDGIDVFFDNVGGEILDAALTALALHARIVICGGISQYNATGPMQGPANYLALIVFRATMIGILVSEWYDRWPEAVREMAGWIAEGKLRSREDVVDGLERFPEALRMLYTGENNGKLVLRVAEA